MRLKLWMGLLCLAASLAAQEAASSTYGGPSILSRGVGQAGRRGQETLNFRFYAQVNGIHDSGLLPLSVQSDGEAYSDDLWGVEGVVGAYGFHTWRHSTLGLDYRGNYRHYSQKTYYDGSDHYLTLDYTTQLKRRLTLSIKPVAGVTSRSFGAYGTLQAMAPDPNSNGIPLADLFDNRTYFLQQSATLVYQKSARLSFSAGGQGFLVRRQSSALADLNGAMAVGDIAYRLNRNQTISAAYNYLHYSFPGSYGSSDGQMVTATFSTRIGRYWQLGLTGGGIRLETKGVRRVAVDPAIAAIVGQTQTTEAFHKINWIPSSNASLTRLFRKSRIGFSYGQGVNPGNGLYLTSRTQQVGVSAGYTALRHWDFSGGVSYMKLSGLGFNTGSFKNTGGTARAAYQLSNLVHLNAQVDSRRASLTTNGFQRDAVRLTFGVMLTPGDVPVSLW